MYIAIEMSEDARRVAILAREEAEPRRSSYPRWNVVERESGLPRDDFTRVFEELCAVGVVSAGMPSVLVDLAEDWPPAPMFGPVRTGRPGASAWNRIRRSVFERDDFTCRYCGERGGRLECDHVTPVARGGGHEDANLVTACRTCNRSKRDKTLEEWRGAYA